jgi:hypothetical protein
MTRIGLKAGTRSPGNREQQDHYFHPTSFWRAFQT